jgi:biotin carboxylase
MMPRLLLLLPSTTYRTQAFMTAARRLGVEVTAASDREQVFSSRYPNEMLPLNFNDPEDATRTVRQFAEHCPIDAVVGVDDATAVLAATLSAALSLPHNSVAAVTSAKNKFQMRDVLRRHGLLVPRFARFSLDDDWGATTSVVTHTIGFPCVIKPIALSASRGVIRADDEKEFIAALCRVEEILQMDALNESPESAATRRVLVESFIPGREVALEGLLVQGQLHVLALFDKPDPLDGPFFEETIYVTPSRLSADVQVAIADTTARAAQALGLQEGPLHAELRLNEAGMWVIEVNPRSIGGRCSKVLRFGATMALEEIILRHALRMEMGSLERERQPAGVMMIPIPRAGVLKEVRGQSNAKAVCGIEDIDITVHRGQELKPYPEGVPPYLGFIFARGETPAFVETALREAHRRLEFVVAVSKRKQRR